MREALICRVDDDDLKHRTYAYPDRPGEAMTLCGKKVRSWPRSDTIDPSQWENAQTCPKCDKEEELNESLRYGYVPTLTRKPSLPTNITPKKPPRKKRKKRPARHRR